MPIYYKIIPFVFDQDIFLSRHLEGHTENASGNRNHSKRGFTKASSRNRRIMTTAAVAEIPLASPASRDHISQRHLGNVSVPPLCLSYLISFFCTVFFLNDRFRIS